MFFFRRKPIKSLLRTSARFVRSEATSGAGVVAEFWRSLKRIALAQGADIISP